MVVVRHSARVRALVKKRTDELRRANNAAFAGARAKSEFLANVSHEIRTPLNGVLGVTNLLLLTDLSAEQAEYGQTIRSSASSLLEVINRVLDSSESESGRLKLSKGPVFVKDEVQHALTMYSGLAREKGIRLEATVTDDLPDELEGDAGRLRQVLSNLISNAVKFTDRAEASRSPCTPCNRTRTGHS